MNAHCEHVAEEAPRISRSRIDRVLVPAETDASYFARRAAEEFAFAKGAADELNRSLHRELAVRYAGLAAAIKQVEEQIG